MNNKLDSLTKARFSIGRQLIKPINTVRYPCIEFVARHPRAGGDPQDRGYLYGPWIPACAGMTAYPLGCS
jgi:hypothetical protein